jgi:hypothetical protein
MYAAVRWFAVDGVRQGTTFSSLLLKIFQVLRSDRVWFVLCQRFGVPPPPPKLSASFSLRDHFVGYSPSILGPTAPFRGGVRPVVESTPLPCIASLEPFLSKRRMTGLLLGDEFLLLNDEIGCAALQLKPPFRLVGVDFTPDNDASSPVPQRRSWTDGTHVVVQSGKVVMLFCSFVLFLFGV